MPVGGPPRWGSPPPIYSPRGSPAPRPLHFPFIPCPRPQWPIPIGSSPLPYSPMMWQPPSPYTVGGGVLEPPGPLGQGQQTGGGYEAMEAEEEHRDGRSTADIIAAQSQDYVDEKLAEYQATIHLLQGHPSPDNEAIGFENAW